MEIETEQYRAVFGLEDGIWLDVIVSWVGYWNTFSCFDFYSYFIFFFHKNYLNIFYLNDLWMNGKNYQK